MDELMLYYKGLGCVLGIDIDTITLDTCKQLGGRKLKLKK
jgi:hypothetical protein